MDARTTECLEALASLVLPGAALAEESAEPESVAKSADAEPPAKKIPFPIRIGASLTQNLGQGTLLFAPDLSGLDSSINPFVLSQLALRGSAQLPGSWQVSVNQQIWFEWTQSDITTTPHQFDLWDTVIQARYSGVKAEALGLAFGFSGGLLLPVSLASRFQGQITTLTLGASGTWSFKGFSAGASFSPNFPVVVPALANAITDDDQRPLQGSGSEVLIPKGCILRDPSERENFACGSLPNLVSFFSSAWVSYALFEGMLSFNAGLTSINTFRNYVQPQDEFTPVWRDLDGAESTTTRLVGSSDLTGGSLSVSYSPAKWFTLSGGTSSFQPLRDASGNGLRFPFWDFVSPRNNFSTLFVDTTFSY
jgi:hypothetical protein